MMKIEDFNKLPKNEQVYKLFHEGREIFVRTQSNQIIKLFLIENLFVEIWYSSKQNIIENITVIDDEKLICLYENEINIQDLVNI